MDGEELFHMLYVWNHFQSYVEIYIFKLRFKHRNFLRISKNPSKFFQQSSVPDGVGIIKSLRTLGSMGIRHHIPALVSFFSNHWALHLLGTWKRTNLALTHAQLPTSVSLVDNSYVTKFVGTATAPGYICSLWFKTACAQRCAGLKGWERS